MTGCELTKSASAGLSATVAGAPFGPEAGTEDGAGLAGGGGAPRAGGGATATAGDLWWHPVIKAIAALSKIIGGNARSTWLAPPVPGVT